jgi:hypothetical protein
MEGTQKYCPGCGQLMLSKRITLGSLLHEVVHTFTHFEKGYLNTLGQLAVRPGLMQREYITGHRASHQKPFPMFVLSGTLCGLSFFFMYESSPDRMDQFFRNYYVFVHAALLPLYAFFTWLLFRKSRMYYGEIMVLMIYMIGFMSLLVIPINLFHAVLSNGVITLMEFTVLNLYAIWTFVNFFHEQRTWLVVLKSIITITFNFMLFQETGTLLLKWLE